MGTKDMPGFSSKWREFGLLVLGYGLFLTYFPIGPLGTVFLTQLSSGWENILAARVLFELATVAVILGCRQFRVKRVRSRQKAVRISFALALAAVVLSFALEGLIAPGWTALLFEALFGAFTAIPKLYWYESFYGLYRTKGRSQLLVCLAGCFFVAAAVMPVAHLMADSLSSMVSIVVTVAISWLCIERGLGTHPADDQEKPEPELSCDYKSSTYMKVVTASFGISWAFSYTVAVNNGFGSMGSSSSSSGVMIAGIALCSLLMLLFSRNRISDTLRFSEMLRWVIVAVVTIWAVMPVSAEIAPALACFLCSAAYIFQSVLMILLIVEICDDYRVSVTSVTAAHYGRFIVFASFSSLAYWVLFICVQPRIAYEVVAAICVISAVVCVPILPSRKSRAMVLAMNALPEEKSREDVLGEAIEMVARTRNLTPREVEVMGMLVEGKTRGDIAEELCVSVWTVKNHIASLYAKVGVHSVPELLDLLEHGESRGKQN